MNHQQKQPTRRSSRRNSILLDHLPDAVRSKILVEFISQEALDFYRGDIKSLVRLGETSKQWGQFVYRDTPQLWKKIGCRKMASMTDGQLAALLRRTNAKEMTKEINLNFCYSITGTGLEPLKGSTDLRSINLNIGSFRPPKLVQTEKTTATAIASAKALEDAYAKRVDPDLKAIVNFVETIPPFSTANDNAPRDLLQKIILPGVTSGGTRGGKKRWKGYKEALVGLQRMFRKNFRISSLPCPRSTCSNPSMHFWLNSKDLNEMYFKTYCTQCHRQDNEDHEDWEDEEEMEKHYLANPDTGILGDCSVKTCKKQFDFADFTICTTCYYSFEPDTCCSDCLKSENAMKKCTMCNAAMCASCERYDHYLEESGEEQLIVAKCEACKVVACGLCREQSKCQDFDCNNHSRWFCSDCSGVNTCSHCQKTRCEENCLTSCASCGDAFCSRNEYYDRYCIRKLKSCVHCFRSFCHKKECANVRRCSENDCVMSVCDLCVAEGKAKKMAKCKHCGDRVCESSGCREAHRRRCRSRRGYHNYY